MFMHRARVLCPHLTDVVFTNCFDQNLDEAPPEHTHVHSVENVKNKG